MFGTAPFGLLSLGSAPYEGDGIAVLIDDATFSVSSELEIHVSTFSFITAADDTPAGKQFRGVLTQAVDYRRSILGNDGFSGFASGSGELAILNLNGAYDYLPQFYALDGRDQEIRIGHPSVRFADWFTVYKGTASGFHVDEQSFRIDLQDYGHKLDVPLQPNLFAGTGGKEGGDDLKGKRKPRAFGYCDNVTAILLDPSTLLFMVNDGPVQDITAVLANGVPLTDEGDVADSATLIAASITSGRFKTCLAEGLFRINFTLDGTQITADVQGDDTGGTFADTLPTIARRMAETALADEEFYEPAFAAYEADAGYEAGYWADQNSTVTIREAVADLLGYGSFELFRRIGKFAIGRFDHPFGAVPALVLVERDIIADTLRRERLPSGLAPPPWRWRVGWGRNWTVQDGTGVADGASDARRSFVAEQLRFATFESAATKTNHPLAQERTVSGFLRNEADAETEAERLHALHSATSSIYRFAVRFRAAVDIEIGEVVSLTFPRFDLTTGRLLRVVELNASAAEDRIEIVGFG